MFFKKYVHMRSAKVTTTQTFPLPHPTWAIDRNDGLSRNRIGRMR